LSVVRIARSAAALGALACLALVIVSCAQSRVPDATISEAKPTVAPTPTPTFPKKPEPVGAVVCSIGKGDSNAVCKKGSAQYYNDVEAAIDYLIDHEPEIFDLTQESAPGTREYKLLDKDAYLAGVLQRLRLAGYCADVDYQYLQLIELKKGNELSEQYDIIWNGFIQRARGGSYKKTCTPSDFPVDPDPDGPPPGSGCGKPYPPPIMAFGGKIHVENGEYWQLDSTPQLLGRDVCAAMGFYDGRSKCALRPEGTDDRVACENWRTGKASDTGRYGPTWNRDGKPCTGGDSGCDNDPDNQYELRVFWNGPGIYHPCAQNGVCGDIEVDR
jgi:hypothetical protein